MFCLLCVGQSSHSKAPVETRYNQVPCITNDILQPDQRDTNIYGTEPRYNERWYNEIYDITFTIPFLKFALLKSSPSRI